MDCVFYRSYKKIYNNRAQKFFVHGLSVSLALFLVTAGPVSSVYAQEKYEAKLVTSQNGMVATQQYLATQAGVEVLREGGNAVDAAVTVGFVLAVTHPTAGNLGGGGFMVAHLAGTGQTVAIDYREKAPGEAYRDMFPR